MNKYSMNEYDSFKCILGANHKYRKNEQCKNYPSHKMQYHTFSLGTPLSYRNFQYHLSIPYSGHPKISKKNIVKYNFWGSTRGAHLAYGLYDRSHNSLTLNQSKKV